MKLYKNSHETSKLHVRKGDKVKILTGNYKGKDGTVIEVLVEKYRALVSGINMVKKHIKPSAKRSQGSVVSVESSVHISNLMLIDGNGTPTRIGRKIDDKGRLVRYSKKSGDFIKNG